MKYATLFELRIEHSFYSDRMCADFEIHATMETEQVLRNHRCAMQTLPNGARIVTAFDRATNQPFLPMRPGTLLRFHLESNNAEFGLFTDIDEVMNKRAPIEIDSQGTQMPGTAIFTNEGRATGTLSLVHGVRRKEGAFADVEIHVGESGIAPGSAVFAICFEAKTIQWAYYCVTDFLPSTADASDLTISDEGPLSEGVRLVFDTEQVGVSDPVAAVLLDRHPNMRVLRAMSREAVDCHERPRKYIVLQHGADRLLGPLPNPSVRRISQVKSQNVLVHTITYRTKP